MPRKPTPKKRTTRRRRTKATEPKAKFTTELRQGADKLDAGLESMMLAIEEGQSVDQSISYTAADGALTLDVIVEMDDPSIQVEGLTVGTTIGNIVTGAVKAENLKTVMNHSNVRHIEASRRVSANLHFSVPDSNASREVLTNGLPSNFNVPAGEDVVIGIVDFGCDFVHRNFRHADLTSRLEYFWDQNGAPTALSPEPFGYGREFDREAINEALSANDPYQALRYTPTDLHGTHVMDIAAGNGLATSDPGMAPGAHLIFVELAGDIDVAGEKTLGSSRRLLEAVDYIFRKADEMGLPAVVNLSLGTHGGPHDGSTFVERGLDVLLERSGRSIVIAAGNAHEADGHAEGSLAPDQSRDLHWQISASNPFTNELEVWYPGDTELKVTLTTPSGQALGPVDLGRTLVIQHGGTVVGHIIHRAQDHNNGDNHIDIILDPQLDPGTWQVSLENVGESEVVFDSWIEREGRIQSSFSSQDVSSRKTLGSISCGREPLIVASYTALTPDHAISDFSSEGPTRDGREKPDIGAPGQDIRAARAGTQGQISFPGTSMAAPHVAGLVALLMESSPSLLSQNDIRRLVLGNASTSPPSGAGWDSRYGHGRIDALAALQAFAPTEVVCDSPPATVAAQATFEAVGPRNVADPFLHSLAQASASTQVPIEVSIRFNPGVAAETSLLVSGGPTVAGAGTCTIHSRDRCSQVVINAIRGVLISPPTITESTSLTSSSGLGLDNLAKGLLVFPVRTRVRESGCRLSNAVNASAVRALSTVGQIVDLVWNDLNS